MSTVNNADADRQVAPDSNSADVGSTILRNEINAEREQYQPSASEKIFAIVKSMLLRGMVVYFFMQFFRKPAAPTASGPAGAVSRVAATNLFQPGTVFDLYIYVSEQKEFGDFNNSNALIWKQSDLSYGDFTSGETQDGAYTFSTIIPASKHVQNNGSIYLHSFIVTSGKSPDPSTGKGKFSKKWTLYQMKQLNKYKKKTYKKTTNLLTGKTDASLEDVKKADEGIKSEIFSHWHPNITVNLVNDYTAWTPGQVPPPLDEFVEFTPSHQNYKPIMYLNHYWNLNKDYFPINETVKSLNLSITYQPLTMFKWQLYSAQNMRNKYNIMGNFLGEEEEEDQDSIKEAFLETNVYLLALTVVISIVHTIFEFFAFKNDIQFWHNRKTLEGLSVRSVFFNVFQSLVVILYVFDNETNTMIKLSCVVGLGIEIWKINKVLDISIDPERKFMGVFPRLVFKDKGSYEESGTKQYDRMAFKYLGMLFFPLACCYMVYSIIYNEHKGWYSFILGNVYGFLLTFGFIMMTPQLFINYKLKSVAHLPWRMMTYKALNTFIDDIFAFVIKMPTAYRLGCFRDDIVFFIFLYQRYIYRVDLSRVNEFGYSGEMKSPEGENEIPRLENDEAIKSNDDKKKD